MSWMEIAERLRARGWNYHRIEWLLCGTWRVEVERCDENDEAVESITEESPTIHEAYEAVLNGTLTPDT